MDQETPAEVTVRELRTNLADILNDVSARGKTVYVTNRGRRIAAVVPLVLAEQAGQQERPDREPQPDSTIRR